MQGGRILISHQGASGHFRPSYGRLPIFQRLRWADPTDEALMELLREAGTTAAEAAAFLAVNGSTRS